MINEYSNIWPVLSLFGLAFNMVGATFLALSSTNWMAEKIRLMTRRRNNGIRFGQIYLKRNGKISEENRSLNDENSFSDLRDFIMSKHNRGDLRIPNISENEVKQFEFERSVEGISVGYITIVFEEEENWGRNWEKALSMQDLEDEVEAKMERDIKETKDKWIRYSWEILAFGFLLQAISMLFQDILL